MLIQVQDSLKFTPNLTRMILAGQKTNTIRLEAKDLKEGDYAELVTRFDENNTTTFAFARITHVETKPLADIPMDLPGHEPYEDKAEMLADFQRYYGEEVTLETIFIIYTFEVVMKV